MRKLIRKILGIPSREEFSALKNELEKYKLHLGDIINVRQKIVGRVAMAEEELRKLGSNIDVGFVSSPEDARLLKELAYVPEEAPKDGPGGHGR